MKEEIQEPEIPYSSDFYHFTFGNRKITYHWFGGFGTIFTSFERGVKVGDLRKVAGVLFYVWRVDKSWKFWEKPEVHWGIEEKISAKWIRQFRKSVFACQCDYDK